MIPSASLLAFAIWLRISSENEFSSRVMHLMRMNVSWEDPIILTMCSLQAFKRDVALIVLLLSLLR